MCIIIQNISHLHTNREILFQEISFSVQQHEKVSIVGNNGIGKSTLLRIISGELEPSAGKIFNCVKPYYIPQHFGQYNNYTVADALGVSGKINSLKKILQGDNSLTLWATLDDDWNIEERCFEALSYWNLPKISLEDKICNFSGGEKTKIFLAGIQINSPKIILYDEPTNHLDLKCREKLYHFICSSKTTDIVVSHDRALLELMQHTYELNVNAMRHFGGNYSFYCNQRKIENDALIHQVETKEKELKKVRKIKQEAFERKQRMDSRGKKKHQKMNTPRSMFKKLRNDAESSSTKLNDAHAKKIEKINTNLQDIRSKIFKDNVMKVDFEDSALHKGKLLVSANEIYHGYSNMQLWSTPLTFEIRSSDRIHLKGDNGAGKTTLVKIILSEIQPLGGKINLYEYSSTYIDQDYSLINNDLSVYEQCLKYNFDSLPEHELKIRLNRFLFHPGFWDKPCSTLSGGEKMRLILCCLMISNNSPDMFILDEPTNNLDICNINILTSTIKEFRGSLIVISHDTYFLNEIEISRTIDLNNYI